MDTTTPRTTRAELSGPAAIHDFLADAYGAGLRMHGAGQTDRMSHRRTEAGGFSLDTLTQSAELTFEVDPLRTVVVTRIATARLSRVCRGSDGRYDRGDLFLTAYPGRPHTSHLSPGELATCVLDPAAVALVAATAPGRRLSPIRFTSLEPTSPASAARWWATWSYVAGLLDHPAADASPLIIATVAHLLAAITLATFPNTALTDPTIEDRHDASTATLRRATAFIDENAADDISSADIAGAVHVSIRAIQLAFRRHLNTTPTAYSRRVRLDHAHRALVDADPAATTVAAVAARWGFVNHSRFTATYRRTYGVLPRATLHGG